DSAVRITHIPTGLVVSCQDERSQHKNKTKAMRVLRARLLDMMKENQHKKISQDRKLQVGTGDRSQKIRTYNFPDRRVTDHRINFTTHNLEDLLNGDLDELIGALIEEDRKAKLK
ncbi:MAG: peptide chain release factor 1, partial [Candidatus Omnitrophica bacterium]|nr:peptide chain release factor 1 [Candidatus Omnitrophota bacterium]